jgi:hypothetical protein
VEYADEGHGFNALVKKEGIPQPLPAPASTPSHEPSQSYGAGPESAPIAPKKIEHPPVYAYGYDVADHKSGDFKSKFEVADGKSVKVSENKNNFISYLRIRTVF